AMALSCRPKLLIADEPTTALDVTIQAQILRLIASLQQRLMMSVLLITHDLGVVASVAHQVVVMYAGRVVETGSVVDVFTNPRHPYTAGLLKSLPHAGGPRRRLLTIPGSVPDAMHFPKGCRFHPRCAYVLDVCRHEVPALNLRTALSNMAAGEHRSACHYVQANPSLGLDKGAEETWPMQPSPGPWWSCVGWPRTSRSVAASWGASSGASTPWTTSPLRSPPARPLGSSESRGVARARWVACSCACSRRRRGKS